MVLKLGLLGAASSTNCRPQRYPDNGTDTTLRVTAALNMKNRKERILVYLRSKYYVEFSNWSLGCMTALGLVLHIFFERVY
ncbi:hypothetical protein Syun_024824 [Stephania yunnanensis]|uniref:Uncharacterized protein n=1 Tax=Stephania yunnanensis TaxID=152371 RepID=A0AAP0EZB7_9MAGN